LSSTINIIYKMSWRVVVEAWVTGQKVWMEEFMGIILYL